MDKEWKRSDLYYKEKILENSQWKLELRNKEFYWEKNKGVSEKKDRPTERILKILFTLNT
jgi:hypothetical protein